MSYFTHLDCSAGCGAEPLDPQGIHHLCTCGAPLLARYDIEQAAKNWPRSSLVNRANNMWRYSEMMPLVNDDQPVTLEEGFTPLRHTLRLGTELGLRSLYVKDESCNPTNSFKARGLSAAVTRANALNVGTVSVPSAGNAANALAAYAAHAGLEAKVFMPRDVKTPFIRECELYGADITLVDGLINEAGRVAKEVGAPLGWYDISTLKEPYRVEGKKTMAYELAEQLDWVWPDWIIYPTGGGTGMVGMWKAFDEIERLGWMKTANRPKMVSVQAEGCAPIVHALENGLQKSETWKDANTIADGLRVPRAIGDFLILQARRESAGTAIAVSDTDMVNDMRELGKLEGISASPEGGATLSALRVLLKLGKVQPNDTVVLFNTGGSLKYLDVLSSGP